MTMQHWIGRPTKTELLPLRLLNSGQISTFGREDFEGDNGAKNPHLDVIYKEDCGTPIATVSKSYSLIQHQTAINATIETLQKLEYPTDFAECELTYTELQERLWLRIRLPDLSFTPSDGKKMMFELSIFNSVDGSLRFGFTGGWYRQICANGMVALQIGETINRRHTKSLSAPFLTEQFKTHITSIIEEEATYRKWDEKKVKIGESFRFSQPSLEDWVDRTLSAEWGKRTAARAYHIICTGRDGKPNIAEANKKIPSYRIPVEPGIEVPGSKPAETLLDVNNALTWISSRQETIQTRYEMMRDVPKLMLKLALST